MPYDALALPFKALAALAVALIVGALVWRWKVWH